MLCCCCWVCGCLQCVYDFGLVALCGSVPRAYICFSDYRTLRVSPFVLCNVVRVTSCTYDCDVFLFRAWCCSVSCVVAKKWRGRCVCVCVCEKISLYSVLSPRGSVYKELVCILQCLCCACQLTTRRVRSS